MDWERLTLAEQIGDIGSEISRAYYWQRKNRPESFKQSLFRALDLIDLSLLDPRWKGRRKELARLREVICSNLCQTPSYFVSLSHIRKYCLPFAFLARRSK